MVTRKPYTFPSQDRKSATCPDCQTTAVGLVLIAVRADRSPVQGLWDHPDAYVCTVCVR